MQIRSYYTRNSPSLQPQASSLVSNQIVPVYQPSPILASARRENKITPTFLLLLAAKLRSATANERNRKVAISKARDEESVEVRSPRLLQATRFPWFQLKQLKNITKDHTPGMNSYPV